MLQIHYTITKVKTVLKRLFRKGGNPSKKLMAMETAEFAIDMADENWSDIDTVF